MGMLGANIEQLRQAAERMSSSATQIHDITRRLTSKIEGTTAWKGRDADVFRADWSATSVPALTRSVQFLERASEALIRQAEEQEKASAAGGGGSGGGGPFKAFTGMGALAGAGMAGGIMALPALVGKSPKDAADWWNKLTDEQRRDIIANDPDRIGNLDGLPAWARDEANRIRLDTEEARLKAELPSATGDRKAQIEESLKALDSVRSALDVKGKTTQLMLLDIDNGAQPKAAIGVGDVDTADHVGVVTPGISTTVAKDMARYVNGMSDLQDRSKALMLAEGQKGTVANIAWLGYDFPTGVTWNVGKMANEIATSKAGVEGGQSLAAFGEGLNASRFADFHLTALGHSYGSLTTGHAVQNTSAFDSVVFFGSPGIGTNNISDLKVPPSQVFVMEAKKDFVADLGWFSGDPNHISGITNLSTSSSVHGNAVTGHVDYLTQQSTSQYNMAAVVTGNSNLAVQGKNNGLGDVLGGAIGGGQRVIVGGIDGGLGGVVSGAGNALGSIVDGSVGIIDDGLRRLGDAWDDLWGKK